MPTTPNMGLALPTVSSTVGPTWAADLNLALGVQGDGVDGHDHTTGKGVQVPSAGLNINADLSFGGNNATDMRAVRFEAQTSTLSAAADDSSVYVNGADLYYKDGNGNNVQITSGGAVNAGPGSITNLNSPAAVTYSGSTTNILSFTKQANQAMSLDGGNVTIREPAVTSAHGITLKSPTSLGADYNVTFPAAVPGSTSFVTMGTSGALANSVSTVGGITKSMQASVGQQLSTTGSGSFSGSAASFTTVTNATVTITTTGRPVMVACVVDDSLGGTAGYLGLSGSGAAATAEGFLQFLRDGATSLGSTYVRSYVQGSGIISFGIPPSSMWVLDTPSAGSHTYALQYRTDGGTMYVTNVKVLAYEL